MKYVKMFGLLVVAAAALLAFAGTASATQVTSPAGTLYTGKLIAESEGHTSLHGNGEIAPTIECPYSKVEGSVETHGTAVTAEGNDSLLVFGNSAAEPTVCTNGYSVHVIKKGRTIFHAISGTGGLRATVTRTADLIEVTVPSIFGTIICVYSTNATHVGELTGGTNPTFDIKAVIPRTSGSSLCGSSGTWTGSYKITTPSTLFFD